ncbi:MAG: hypothetical protein GJU76_16225 [Gallionella sp.]|jgi:hypothetical protein|nr:hypothetical protein [Gallionella sp.]
MIATPEKIAIFVAGATLLRRLLHPQLTAREKEKARQWFESFPATKRTRVQRGMVNGNVVEAW